MHSERNDGIRGLFRWVLAPFAAIIVYILSSGPVLGIAFRLREATHWDGFYAAMMLYYPLLVSDGPAERYIEWWVVDVFHTVGPG